MTTTHVVFEGGTRDGSTASYTGLDADSNIYFDTAFEPHELYKRTEETRTIDGVEHVIYRPT